MTLSAILSAGTDVDIGGWTPSLHGFGVDVRLPSSGSSDNGFGRSQVDIVGPPLFSSRSVWTNVLFTVTRRSFRPVWFSRTRRHSFITTRSVP